MSLLPLATESRRASCFSNLGQQTESSFRLRWDGLLWCAIVLAFFAGRPPVRAEDGNKQVKDALPVETVVQQMVLHNQQRAEEIGSYTSRRHYHIEYKGFPHSAEADLIVDATCDGPSGRHFEVVSESGSGLLVHHVLMKLLETEAQGASHHTSNDLTPANYNFALIRSEIDDGRRMYVLQVEPKISRSLLYRGAIWVDAQDFAVARIEAQPAKNPSFWIHDTRIHHVYEKTGEFWLPELNKTESKVRLGGEAILTINYGDYRFLRAGADQPSVSGAQ